jgi:hypothetical protein
MEGQRGGGADPSAAGSQGCGLLSHLIVAVIDGVNIQTMLGMDDIPLHPIADHLIRGRKQP